MRNILTASAVVAFGLSACASQPPAGAGPYPHYRTAPIGYDAFYDDFYGPFYDGYWGPGDVFYYSDAAGRPFRRDEAHHFRHEGASGFHAVHGLGGGGHPRPAMTPRRPG
jgi:hypothetical protein